jgi:cystathionine gamma-synthase
MTRMTHEHAPATRIVALGREERVPGAQVGSPLVLTSTYVADGPVNYARVGNPTWSAFEEAVGSLEGGDALVLASGLAAASAVLALVPVGGVVVAPAAAYNGVVVGLAEREARGELTVRRVEVTDTAGTVAALDGADLVWLESPSNPLLEVADLPTILAAARARGVTSVVDNTFATPLVQRPLADGADVVVHSATKYLSGHSDVVLGVVVTRPDDGGRALHARLLRHRTLNGAIAGPVETWLALRGLRTLHLRFERACANAAELATRLAAHPRVETCRYPGFGAIVSFDVTPSRPAVGAADAAEAVAAACRVIMHSTSLGGVESMIERRRRQPGEPAAVPVNLLRLSVGIEDVEDLWEDLRRALDDA